MLQLSASAAPTWRRPTRWRRGAAPAALDDPVGPHARRQPRAEARWPPWWPRGSSRCGLAKAGRGPVVQLSANYAVQGAVGRRPRCPARTRPPPAARSPWPCSCRSSTAVAPRPASAAARAELQSARLELDARAARPRTGRAPGGALAGERAGRRWTARRKPCAWRRRHTAWRSSAWRTASARPLERLDAELRPVHGAGAAGHRPSRLEPRAGRPGTGGRRTEGRHHEDPHHRDPGHPGGRRVLAIAAFAVRFQALSGVPRRRPASNRRRPPSGKPVETGGGRPRRPRELDARWPARSRASCSTR